jgi:hypothetical protein
METEKEIQKTKRDVYISYWNGHLTEMVRLEILIDFLKEVDPKRIMKQERKDMGGMPVLNDVTAEMELAEFKKQLVDQKIYLKVIQAELDKEEKK